MTQAFLNAHRAVVKSDVKRAVKVERLLGFKQTTHFYKACQGYSGKDLLGEGMLCLCTLHYQFLK